MRTRVITFGTFDLFHVGHLNILKRAKALGDYLVVGVSSDQLNYSKKKALPIYNQNDRMAIVQAITYVDEVFLEESLDLKKYYIENYQANVLVMGDDWFGKFDFCKHLCEVKYLSRTPEISSTLIKDGIREQSSSY